MFNCGNYLEKAFRMMEDVLAARGDTPPPAGSRTASRKTARDTVLPTGDRTDAMRAASVRILRTTMREWGLMEARHQA